MQQGVVTVGIPGTQLRDFRRANDVKLSANKKKETGTHNDCAASTGRLRDSRTLKSNTWPGYVIGGYENDASVFQHVLKRLKCACSRVTATLKPRNRIDADARQVRKCVCTQAKRCASHFALNWFHEGHIGP